MLGTNLINLSATVEPNMESSIVKSHSANSRLISSVPPSVPMWGVCYDSLNGEFFLIPVILLNTWEYEDKSIVDGSPEKWSDTFPILFGREIGMVWEDDNDGGVLGYTLDPNDTKTNWKDEIEMEIERRGGKK